MTQEYPPGRAVRRLVGDIEVIALSDGVQTISPALFPDADPQDLASLAAAAGHAADPMPVPVNTFLIRADGCSYLVDAGTGPSRGAHLGHVPAALAEAGVTPDEIDVVLMTHMHGDHAGGLLHPSGETAFPSAELWLAEEEAAFWLDPDLPGRVPERMKATLANAVKALDAYRERTTRFSAGREVAPGIRTVPLPGHTPGQTGYLVESRGERLLIWADIIHVAALQFARPHWTVGFDVDGRQAAETRRRIFERAAAENLPVAGMHLPFPGFGRVVGLGEGYAYAAEPADL
ncbi:MBL fold metallo-hydrolase [Enterovirga aerilata]|uniref:MBL fold metallo-hydrolase n=1 Tax=Enterovirga aerilata TaxID=2730920 RepID=A0A849I571_9HYPH|nr:MBL fold metallo-hydrolase [Enterovirga sp. DB1703]NNM71250.1 MBL fold metallo-hydrolase [Enterovirga sp. DB1703]